MDLAFSECVEALKDLRRTIHSSTDPSVGIALEDVIFRLESYKHEAVLDESDVRKTVAEGLMIISSLLSCCVSVADLMGRFR